MSYKKLFNATEKSSDWVQQQFLRNVCYSTLSDMNYNISVQADLLAEAKELVANHGGSEVTDTQIGALRMKIERAENQETEFAELHKIACEAYKAVTGYTWTKPAPAQKLSEKQKTDNASFIKKRIAS